MYVYPAGNPISNTDRKGLKLDLTAAGSLVQVLDVVRQTCKGKDAYQRLDMSPLTYKLVEGMSDHDLYLDRVIKIVPSWDAKIWVCTESGDKRISASLARCLAHEMGHAVIDDERHDGGGTEIEAIFLWENPVAEELKEYPRILRP